MLRFEDLCCCHPSTQNVILSGLANKQVDWKTVHDFGLNTREHMVNMRTALRHDVIDFHELDEARCNGPRITELVREGLQDSTVPSYVTARDYELGRGPTLPEIMQAQRDRLETAREPSKHRKKDNQLER